MLNKIADRSKKTRFKILAEANKLFGNVKTQIFWEGGIWWIKVFIDGDRDVIEYNAYIDDNDKIDFEVRGLNVKKV